MRFIWYSPITNEIRLLGAKECKQETWCHWEDCYISCLDDPTNQFYYIGVL